MAGGTTTENVARAIENGHPSITIKPTKYRYFCIMEEEISEDPDIKLIEVDAGQGPVRIDKYLMDKLERVTRNKIQIGIKAGAVLVNEQEVKANYKVRPLDKITIVMPPSHGSTDGVIPQDIPLDIIYEDDDLLVVNKVAGMVVHPGISNPDGTLVNALAFHTGQTVGSVLPGNSSDRPGLVHRIDKHTSGLLVVAKNDFTLSALAKQFFDHTIHRKYLALVWGVPEEDEGTIDEYVGRHPKDRVKQTVFVDGEDGKHAITHYKVEEEFYYVSLISCQLETGRTHQIRIHMKHLGHPLFNDLQYDGRQIRKGTVYTKYKQFVNNCFDLISGQALHASELGFIHPSTNKQMNFSAPLPDGFNEIVVRWRNYLANRKSHS